jgi:hypothetical protein
MLSSKRPLLFGSVPKRVRASGTGSRGMMIVDQTSGVIAYANALLQSLLASSGYWISTVTSSS